MELEVVVDFSKFQYLKILLKECRRVYILERFQLWKWKTRSHWTLLKEWQIFQGILKLSEKEKNGSKRIEYHCWKLLAESISVNFLANIVMNFAV